MWPLHLGYMDEALLFDNSPGGMQINFGLKRKGSYESFGEKLLQPRYSEVDECGYGRQRRTA